jgi:hypothetical protein
MTLFRPEKLHIAVERRGIVTAELLYNEKSAGKPAPDGDPATPAQCARLEAM